MIYTKAVKLYTQPCTRETLQSAASGHVHRREPIQNSSSNDL